MKELILKVAIHIFLSFALTQLESLVFHIGGQTITTDRFECQFGVECDSSKTNN